MNVDNEDPYSSPYFEGALLGAIYTVVATLSFGFFAGLVFPMPIPVAGEADPSLITGILSVLFIGLMGGFLSLAIFGAIGGFIVGAVTNQINKKAICAWSMAVAAVAVIALVTCDAEIIEMIWWRILM